MDILIVRESTYMHKPLYSHPENPHRVMRARSALLSHDIPFNIVSIEEVSLSDALNISRRIHDARYIDRLVKLSREAPLSIDEDTYMDSTSLKLALGSMHLAYAYANSSRRVFIITRPPGHHAGIAGRALGASTQGFCILNNAASAVLGFKDAGFKRIAVIDFDAHHGNGTMEIFMAEKILQIDIHQDPDTLYPHTGYPDEIGVGEGYGFKANIVLPPGTGDDLYQVILEKIGSILDMYQPDAIVVSAGFDGFDNDGLADLSLTEISYYNLGLMLRRLKTPVVAVLEGGYSIGLERGLVAFTNGLLGVSESYPPQTTTPKSLYRRGVENLNRVYEKISSKVH